MPDRTVIPWDKDDVEAVGLVKIDLLGLGMLTLLQAIRLIRRTRGVTVDLAQLGYDDQAVYDLMCRADTVGVFQVERRAQMNTLPRMQAALLLRPRRRGGAHPSRTDPGRHGASVPAPPRRARGGHLSASVARADPQAHARRAALPGAGHEGGDRRGRLHARRRPIGCGARWARSGRARRWRRSSAACARACARTASTRRRRTRSSSRSTASRSTAFRSRTPRGSRCSSTRRLAPALLRAGVQHGAPQRAADGVLLAGDDRRRRAAPRGEDAARGREPQRVGMHDRGGRQNAVRDVDDPRRRRGGARRDRAHARAAAIRGCARVRDGGARGGRLAPRVAGDRSGQGDRRAEARGRLGGARRGPQRAGTARAGRRDGRVAADAARADADGGGRARHGDDRGVGGSASDGVHARATRAQPE